MSKLDGQRRIEDFEVLSVYRRIEGGAEKFVDLARGLELNMLQPETTGLIEVQGESNLVRTVRPYCDFTGARDLKLDMYSRRDVPESRSEAKFRTLRRRLKKGESQHAKNKGRGPERDLVTPLTDQLDYIQKIEFGIEDGEVELDIVAISFRTSPDVNNGKYELTMIPNIASKVGRMLLKQQAHIHKRVRESSRQIAYPSSSSGIEIPFVNVRTIPEDLVNGERKFHENLRKMLPLTVSLGDTQIE